MRCPKCGKPITETRLNPPDEEVDYIEVEATCQDEHLHFARVREEDLMEVE